MLADTQWCDPILFFETFLHKIPFVVGQNFDETFTFVCCKLYKIFATAFIWTWPEIWRGGRKEAADSRCWAQLTCKSCNQGVSQISAPRQQLSLSVFAALDAWGVSVQTQFEFLPLQPNKSKKTKQHICSACFRFMSSLNDANFSIFWVSVTLCGDIPSCYCETISTWILDRSNVRNTGHDTSCLSISCLSTISLHYLNWIAISNYILRESTRHAGTHTPSTLCTLNSIVAMKSCKF